MNDEAPDMISINPAVAARHPCSDKRIGDVLYRRVDPPVAPARCIHCDPSFTPSGPDGWCNCRCHNKDHEDPAPAPADERDKALARETIESIFRKRGESPIYATAGRLFDELEDKFASALATVRAEVWRAAFTHAIKIVKEQPSTIGDWMTQSDVAANLRHKIVWALESARTGKVEG